MRGRGEGRGQDSGAAKAEEAQQPRAGAQAHDTRHHGPQVLPEGHHVDVVGAQVLERLPDLVPLLAHAEHDRGLRDELRRRVLGGP